MTFKIFIPYLAVALAVALQGITLIYIPPNSHKRKIMLPVILLPASLVCLTAQHASFVGPWNVFIGLEFGALLGLEVFDNVCLSKVSYHAVGVARVGARKKNDDDDPDTTSAWSRFCDKVRWSVDIAINKRHINRADQPRNVPLFDSSRPQHVPSRRSFLLFRAARFILLYLALDLITSQPLEDAQVKFAAGKERIFTRVLARDISPAEIGEALGIIMAHCVCGYMSLLLGYDFFSLVAVGLCGGRVSDWRPLFGDIRQVYTIRTFWRRLFWHQLLLRPLDASASFLTHSLLGLPRYSPRGINRIVISANENSGKLQTSPPEQQQQQQQQPPQSQTQASKLLLITAYTKLTLIFLLSGLVHINSDHILGIRFRDSHCISLFLCQACGIIVEDAAQWTYRCVTGSEGNGPVKVWHRLVGYAWLVVFALWAAPGWAFSVVRLEVPPTALPVMIFPRR
ncbi:TRI7-like toxin biosynthesis protein [Histoplasma ohiense]|nr:TRI7-like toxin biosynthesis protein [Histoplasma ohiense (nom. inval.)]